MIVELNISSPKDMAQFAQRVAAHAKVGDWIGLIGALGTGKTVFSKGFIAALGFEDEVSSPSYALIHNYDPPDVSLSIAHSDLYRIERDHEYQELGLDDVLGYGVALVEWADKYPLVLPGNRLDIEIIKLSDSERKIMMKLYGDWTSRWI